MNSPRHYSIMQNKILSHSGRGTGAQKSHGFFLLCIPLLFLILFSGCKRSHVTSFYVLNPTAESSAPIAPTETTNGSLGIAVFPVELPAYLDRPQIVTRTGSNTLRFSEYHKWAEALAPALRNLLVENLASKLPSHQISAIPSRKILPYDYSVEVRVKRFEGVSDQEAVLLADWAIYRTGSEAPILRRTSSLTAPIDGPDYAALTSSLSRLVDNLAQDIAKGINEVASK